MRCREKSPLCFYCRIRLVATHEHDHYPTPVRAGGKWAVCACINCHNLKDRIDLDHWDLDAAVKATMGLFDKCEPLERIVLAKMYALMAECLSGDHVRGVPAGPSPREDNIIFCPDWADIVLARYGRAA